MDLSSNEPLPIKDIVNKVMDKLCIDAEGEKRLTKEDVNKAWRDAVGNFASKRSRPILLKKGRLVVNVEDSSLLYSLTLRKQEILKGLIAGLSNNVKEIQFRIGEASGEEKSKAKSQKSKSQGRKG